VCKNRDDIEKFFRKCIKKEYDIHKMLKVLDTGLGKDEN
jgi:hypothetical protein